MTPFWKKHLGDAIMISFFSIASICLAIYAAIPKGSSSNQAEITLDGQRLHEHGLVDLSSYGEEETSFTIQGLKSEMSIGVKKGAICVLSSSCPSQYCVHQGWISSSGRPLVCAYNHIVITILGSSEADVIL